MRMKMDGGWIYIIEADQTQNARIKSWGLMKWSRKNAMWSAAVSGDTFNLARVLDELFRMRDLTLQRSKDALDDADRISNIAMYRAYISAIEIVRRGGKRYGKSEEGKGTSNIDPKG